MLSMFYGEDIENMVGGINFIYNAISSHSERKFSFMAPNEGLAFIRTHFKGFHLLDYSMKEIPVGAIQGVNIIGSLSGKLKGVMFC